MKDFGRWFQEQAQPTPAPTTPSIDDQLEAMGLDLMKDGGVWGKCCVCKAAICWTNYLSVEEIVRGGVGEAYCGKDPRCCP